MARFSSTAEVRSSQPLSLQQILERAIIGFLVWFFVYLFIQEEDGVFARTVDLVESPWLVWTFLNVPLQLGITLAIVGCLATRRQTWQRLGVGLSVLNTVLVVGHWVLAFLHA